MLRGWDLFMPSGLFSLILSLIKADNALIEYVSIFVSRETSRSDKAWSLSRFTSSAWLQKRNYYGLRLS